MIKIFVGLIFIFFKTNLSFWDIGITYYITNIIGYILLFFGVNELSRTISRLVKIKPYITIMIIHSIVFLILNITDNSPLTMSLSTTLSTITALVGSVVIIVGMLMIFIIISELMKHLISHKNQVWLEKLVTVMMFLFILTGISAYLDLIPLLTNFMMGTLFILIALFLIGYYSVYLSINKKYS